MNLSLSPLIMFLYFWNPKKSWILKRDSPLFQENFLHHWVEIHNEEAEALIYQQASRLYEKYLTFISILTRLYPKQNPLSLHLSLILSKLHLCSKLLILDWRRKRTQSSKPLDCLPFSDPCPWSSFLLFRIKFLKS